ncbi:MAG: DUF4288 domain-containing protein [Gammaproteobacteria bacterium]
MWYVANLLLKSVHQHCLPRENLWEETMRLIKADTREEALSKAEQIGKSLEYSYPVSGSDVVTWVFIRVESIFEIDDDDLKDGTEVFSRFLHESEVNSLLKPFEADGPELAQ